MVYGELLTKNTLIFTPLPMDIISSVISPQKLNFLESAPLRLGVHGDLHT